MSRERRRPPDERLLVRSKANRRTARLRTKYERRLLDLRIDKEVELRQARFHEVEALASEHRIFHEREHTQYADQLKATANTLGLRLDTTDIRIGKLLEDEHLFLTVERFEREHGLLEQRLEERWSAAQQKITAEETVTVSQSVRQKTLDEIASNGVTGRRWQITTAIALVALAVLLVFNLIALVLQHAV